KTCKGDPVQRAIVVFQKLGMQKTEQRNGVLIYLATEDHKFAIIGDQGINEHVPDHFWDDERDLMQSYFRKHQFTEGLIQGIIKVSEQLRDAFPSEVGDRNELENEISFDEGEA
ncbi:MAG: TPM domain-containing protein, partial [Bacteroidota bacterium]